MGKKTHRRAAPYDTPTNIQDAIVLRADGTARQLPLPSGRRSASPPDPRYNHAMVSINEGRQAYLLGGCRGDGTRLKEAFVLDLTSPVVGGEGGNGTDEEEEGVMREGEEDAAQVCVYDRCSVFVAAWMDNARSTMVPIFLAYVVLEAYVADGRPKY